MVTKMFKVGFQLSNAHVFINPRNGEKINVYHLSQSKIRQNVSGDRELKQG